MIGGFEAAVWAVLGIGLMMEAAVGKGSTQPFVKEEKEQRDLHALGGEAVGVAGASRTIQLIPLIERVWMFGNGAEGKIKERTTMKIVTLAALVLIGAGNWAVACQNGNCDRNGMHEPAVTTPLPQAPATAPTIMACDNRNCR